MISIPLAKLSVAQDTDPSESKFFWQHETQQIHLIIDDYGTQPSSQLLKLVQGAQIRHSIEIERQINEGHQLIQDMEARGVNLTVEQLPISAIIRCPLLALRWRLPNNKIRRVQLKFGSSQDFDAVYNHLYQLGLYMTTMTETNAQIRNPVPKPKKPLVQPTKNKLPVVRHSQPLVLSCPPSKLAEISNRPFTATNAPTSLESGLQEAAHARPNSAYTSGVHGESSSTGPLASSLSNPMFVPRPSSGSSDVERNNVIFPPTHSTSGSVQGFTETSERPESAMLYNRPNSSEALLPPRRELPFQRSSSTLSAGSDSVRPSSRPSTGLMGPPPLPARVASLKPRSSRENIQLPNLPPLPQPTYIDQSADQMSSMHQPPQTPDYGHNLSMPTSSSPYKESEQQRFLNQSPASSPLSTNRTEFTAASTSQPLSPFRDVTQTSYSDMSQNVPTTCTKPGSSGRNADSFRTTLHFDPGSNEGLRAYAMQSEDRRRAALNEFIFQNLQNDDFLALVEDMETCWARVALGTK